jgi:hypothetical protein
MHRQVTYDAEQVISEIKVGPDEDGLVETLQGACMIFMWGAEPFARAYDPEAISKKIRRLCDIKWGRF